MAVLPGVQYKREGERAGWKGGEQCDNDKEDHVTSLVLVRWFGCGDKGMIKGVP